MKKVQPSDEELISRVLAGETGEFETLVHRYEAAIFSLLIRLTGDRHVAEELTQDSFVRAYKGLRAFERRAALRTWLTRIAMNVANSYLSSRAFRDKQKSQSYVAAEHEALAIGLVMTDDDSDDMMLRQAIAELPQKYREPLILCRIEKRTYFEAGALLGIPPGTVCSRINTALGMLRKQLRGDEQ